MVPVLQTRNCLVYNWIFNWVYTRSFMSLKFYIWLMGWSGKLSAWAWRKQAAIVRSKNRQDEENYLKELKKKL